MAWVPLESNPEVMNKFMERLGVSEKWQIADVYGVSPDMLGFIPRPVLAFILLFPSSEVYKKMTKNQMEKIEELKATGGNISKNLFFMKQIVRNACGTIALVHSLANNTDQLGLADGVLKKFLEETKDMDYEARGLAFQDNAGISNIHNEVAVEGQTEAPNACDPVIGHFVTFVEKDGCLYELDGSKGFPVNHGPTTPDNFVEDTAKLILGIMEKDPEELRFSVCALTPAE